MAEQHHLCSSAELSHRPSLRATGEGGERTGAREINQMHIHYLCVAVHVSAPVYMHTCIHASACVCGVGGLPL